MVCCDLGVSATAETGRGARVRMGVASRELLRKVPSRQLRRFSVISKLVSSVARHSRVDSALKGLVGRQLGVGQQLGTIGHASGGSGVQLLHPEHQLQQKINDGRKRVLDVEEDPRGRVDGRHVAHGQQVADANGGQVAEERRQRDEEGHNEKIDEGQVLGRNWHVDGQNLDGVQHGRVLVLLVGEEGQQREADAQQAANVLLREKVRANKTVEDRGGHGQEIDRDARVEGAVDAFEAQ